MDILDVFYRERVRNRRFHPRKLTLPEYGSFQLYGARGVGKTALVIAWLNALGSAAWLYIDCLDPVFALEDIDVTDLEAFAAEEGITTVVLDHYYEGFLDRLPQVEQCIVVSRTLLPDTGSTAYELFGLDYEEFLSFGSDRSATQSFNRFLKVGTLPALAYEDSGTLPVAMRGVFWGAFHADESRLMLILARFQGRRVTAHQLYIYARESFRISKDWLYRTLRRFEEEKVILFVPDRLSRGGRRMFLYDYALSAYLHRGQSFAVTFESMVVLALIKHRFAFEALGNLGYRTAGGTLVVPAPFLSEEDAWRQMYEHTRELAKHTVNRVALVSVANRYRFELGKMVFECVPFSEWSIVNEEGY